LCEGENINRNDLDVLEIYLTKALDEKTVKNYLSALNRIDVSLDELKQLNDDELVKLLNDNIDMKERWVTKFAYLWLLKYLNKSHLIMNIKRFKQPARRVKKKWIAFSEVKKLVDSAKKIEDKLIIMLEYDTACRISAILNISIDDISKNYKTVTVTEEKVKEIRTVALSAKTIEVLKNYIIQKDIKTGSIFTNESYHNVWDRMRRLSIKVLGKDISTHWFRASRAVHLFQAGYDVITVKELLGHKTLDATYRYLQESGISSIKLMEKEEPNW
jgi:integrase/recombinase XerD